MACYCNVLETLATHIFCLAYILLLCILLHGNSFACVCLRIPVNSCSLPFQAVSFSGLYDVLSSKPVLNKVTDLYNCLKFSQSIQCH